MFRRREEIQRKDFSKLPEKLKRKEIKIIIKIMET